MNWLSNILPTNIIGDAAIGASVAGIVLVVAKGIIENWIESGIDTHFQGELAELNGEIQKSNELLASQLKIYETISKGQYEVEYSNYMLIWEKLQSFVECTKNLRIIGEKPPFTPNEQKEVFDYRERRWEEERQEFDRLIREKAPFYQEEHYEKFMFVRTACDDLHDYVGTFVFTSEIDKKTFDEKIKAINECEEKALKSLRKYIQELKQNNIPDLREDSRR